MAEAYATFAARGLHCAPRPVTQILDSARQRREGLRVAVHPGHAAERRRRREQRAARRDRGRLRLGAGAAGAPAAGKTGTTQEQKAVWFFGYTRTSPPPPRSPASTPLGRRSLVGRPSTASPSTRPPAPASRRRSGATHAIGRCHGRPALRRLRLSRGHRGRRVHRPRRGRRSRRRATHGHGHGGGHGGRHTAADGGRPPAADPRSRSTDADRQPSWRRTSAATAPPSARPLTWGWTTPITLPIALIPSPAAPVCVDRRR